MGFKVFLLNFFVLLAAVLKVEYLVRNDIDIYLKCKFEKFNLNCQM